jgi:trans-2,3-dihydro-3-hydroxyanthranilate isomerase
MEPVSAGPVTRRRLSYLTADVFTTTPLTGNPLAVFPEAKGLSAAEMQAVAREMNLSETVFVFPPENPAHTRKLRIFTPGGELPFAGHPTLGTAHVLVATGRVPTDTVRSGILSIVFEEVVGPVAVHVTLRDQTPIRTQLVSARLPEEGPAPPANEVLARVLSLRPEEIEIGGDRPEAWSCGVPFLFVPLRSEASLSRAHLDIAQWQAHTSAYWANHLYPFVRADDPGLLHGRMFGPAMGIVEDPATGAAAAALGGYLHKRRAPGGDPVLRVAIRQGVAMGRPSTLYLEAERGTDGRLAAVRVAGESVLVSEGTFWV